MQKITMMINESRIEKRLDELAKEIMKDYKDEEIVFLGVLKGASMFMMELAKRIKNNIEFEFVQIQSYEGDVQTGKINMKKEISGDIEGKNIIIIEDIVDTGRTLEFLQKYLREQNAKTVKVCTLLTKPSRRIVELDVDYIGFQVPDEFVIGYGMDYNQKYRNLPYIAKVDLEG